jgi:hypothetical protein
MRHLPSTLQRAERYVCIYGYGPNSHFKERFFFRCNLTARTAPRNNFVPSSVILMMMQIAVVLQYDLKYSTVLRVYVQYVQYVIIVHCTVRTLYTFRSPSVIRSVSFWAAVNPAAYNLLKLTSLAITFQ